MLQNASRAASRVVARVTNSSPSSANNFSAVQRRHAGALANVKAPEYKTVNFVREDVAKVIEEVPQFEFYEFPEGGQPYPFKDIALDREVPISNDVSEAMSKMGIEAADGKVRYSKLENGMRIASIDKGGRVASLSCFVSAGSRYETPENAGVSHMIEAMAFRSTAHLSHLRTVKTLEHMGAHAGCNVGREEIIYFINVLREYVPLAVPLLSGNVLFPRLLPWELAAAGEKVQAANAELKASPEGQVSELLMQTAYHNNTLGNNLFSGTTEFTADEIRQYMLDHFSPERMAFVAVNVDHDVFAKWVMRSFADYTPIPHKERAPVKPKYTGGFQSVSASSPLVHLCIGFEAQHGWQSNDVVALSVLHTLLGGGGSFSAGGPGKGMHSRAYTRLLTKPIIETGSAFSHIFSDTGVFGMYAEGDGSKAGEIVKLMLEPLMDTKYTAEELSRAKNMLKSGVYMNLEQRNIVMEDLGHQLIRDGKVASGADLAKLIDAVTAPDLARVVKALLSTPPTVVAYGDTSSVPHYSEIQKMCK